MSRPRTGVGADRHAREAAILGAGGAGAPLRFAVRMPDGRISDLCPAMIPGLQPDRQS
jgi:hypothetical protein